MEIMNDPYITEHNHSERPKGYCHIAISVGNRDKVDKLTEMFRSEGISIIGEPRTIGDGYYESVIADPEGNLIEITI